MDGSSRLQAPFNNLPHKLVFSSKGEKFNKEVELGATEQLLLLCLPRARKMFSFYNKDHSKSLDRNEFNTMLTKLLKTVEIPPPKKTWTMPSSSWMWITPT